ncbi:hypothetical protein GUH87_17820 [Xanthomonas citri pv. citri]|nr:hypothetical protein [Xanthomonas citri pv. citri]
MMGDRAPLGLADESCACGDLVFQRLDMMHGWVMEKLTAGDLAVVRGACRSGDLRVDAQRVRRL